MVRNYTPPYHHSHLKPHSNACFVILYCQYSRHSDINGINVAVLEVEEEEPVSFSLSLSLSLSLSQNLCMSPGPLLFSLVLFMLSAVQDIVVSALIKVYVVAFEYNMSRPLYT